MPEVLPTRCVRYRFRYSECTRCEQACPHEAIQLTDEGVSLDASRCKACGLCVSACPTETFTVPELSPLALIERARGRDTLTMACVPCGSEGNIHLPCLGALGAPLLAYVLAQGTELQLLGSASCATCSHGARGGAQLAANLDAVETLRVADRLGRWAAFALPQTSSRKALPATELSRESERAGHDARAARRSFFRRVASPGAAVSAAPAVANAVAIPLRAIRAARATPSAQRDLLQLLGLAEAQSTLSTHACLPAGDLRLEAGCTGCEACARACPTAALQVRETTSAWALGFDAALCVACGVCTEACQPRVLHLSDTLPVASFSKREPQALHQMPKRRCTRCDRSIVVNGDRPLCEVCAGDEEDFDAIFG